MSHDKWMDAAEAEIAAELVADRFPIGSWAIYTNSALIGDLFQYGMVEGYSGTTVRVRVPGGGLRYPSPSAIRPGEWCEHGEHHGPGQADDDYMCHECRRQLSNVA